MLRTAPAITCLALWALSSILAQATGSISRKKGIIVVHSWKTRAVIGPVTPTAWILIFQERVIRSMVMAFTK